MASPRTHDIVLADGTFRIVLTSKRRVIAVLDAPTTALGPLHVVLAIDRAPFLPRGVSPLVLTHAPTMQTAGLFDSIGHAIGGVSRAVEHAAEGAFNAASHAATTIARPAFDVIKVASSEGVHALAHTIPFLPERDRRKLDAAARVIMRAKLGDLDAKHFIRGIADAAKAGVHAAQSAGDALLSASKIVAHVADLPVEALGHVPGVGGALKSLSPFQKWDQIATSIQHGDFKRLAAIAKDTLSEAQAVVSLVPGVGTGISSAISAGLAALAGGTPLEIAIHAAYGAIPIPPGVRQVTDTVLDTILALARHPNLTDVSVNVARDQVPAGLPRDVFDTLVNLVVHRQPVTRVAGGLVDHFVKQYAPAGVGLDVPRALAAATSHVPNLLTAIPVHAAAASMTTAGVGDVVGIAGDVASGDIAGAASKVGGAAGGSLAKGAAIGGAIGSVIPGVGTAIGGAVGAIIGGIGSLFGGSSGPIDFEHLPGDVGRKLVRQVADKIRHAPRWQAHFQAVYRHLPAGTSGVKGLNDLVAHELFPNDVPGKDATTGHADGLAEWFAQQSDWETLLHGPGVPPGDRHQLEARIRAAIPHVQAAQKFWTNIFHAGAKGPATPAPTHAAHHVAPPPPPSRAHLAPAIRTAAPIPTPAHSHVAIAPVASSAFQVHAAPGACSFLCQALPPAHA